MEVSDSAMSEESTSTASSSNVPFDEKSVCQVCFVKGNKIFAFSNVPIPLHTELLRFVLYIFARFVKKKQWFRCHKEIPICSTKFSFKCVTTETF